MDGGDGISDADADAHAVALTVPLSYPDPDPYSHPDPFSDTYRLYYGSKPGTYRLRVSIAYVGKSQRQMPVAYRNHTRPETLSD